MLTNKLDTETLLSMVIGMDDEELAIAACTFFGVVEALTRIQQEGDIDIEALVEHILSLPVMLYKSIAWNDGMCLIGTILYISLFI